MSAWFLVPSSDGGFRFADAFVGGTTAAELLADPATDVICSPFGKAGEDVLRACFGDRLGGEP